MKPIKSYQSSDDAAVAATEEDFFTVEFEDGTRYTIFKPTKRQREKIQDACIRQMKDKC